MKIVAASLDHIDSIRPDERSCIELREFFGLDYRQGIRQSLIGSTQAWTMMSRDTVVAMFGVGPLNLLEGLGRLWIVPSDLSCHRLAFARACKRVLPLVFEQYETLVSAFDSRHEDVARWVRWLGADLKASGEITSITLRRP